MRTYAMRTFVVLVLSAMLVSSTALSTPDKFFRVPGVACTSRDHADQIFAALSVSEAEGERIYYLLRAKEDANGQPACLFGYFRIKILDELKSREGIRVRGKLFTVFIAKVQGRSDESFFMLLLVPEEGLGV